MFLQLNWSKLEAMRSKELSADLRNRIGIDLEKGTEKSLHLYRSQRAQWSPSFVNGRTLEPPRIFLDLPRPAKPRVTLTEWRWENLSEYQPSRQHSSNQ